MDESRGEVLLTRVARCPTCHRAFGFSFRVGSRPPLDYVIRCDCGNAFNAADTMGEVSVEPLDPAREDHRAACKPPSRGKGGHR